MDLLNTHDPSASWRSEDIAKALRLGKPRAHGSDPRPILVQFCRWSDKMAVLGDSKLRDCLRQSGVKVASDLTMRQRELVDFHRKQGKIAYIYNGKLQVRDRQEARQQARQWTYHESDRDHRFAEGNVLHSEDWPHIQRNWRNGQNRDWLNRQPTGNSYKTQQIGHYARRQGQRNNSDSHLDLGDASDKTRYRQLPLVNSRDVDYPLPQRSPLQQDSRQRPVVPGIGSYSDVTREGVPQTSRHERSSQGTRFGSSQGSMQRSCTGGNQVSSLESNSGGIQGSNQRDSSGGGLGNSQESGTGDRHGGTSGGSLGSSTGGRQESGMINSQGSGTGDSLENGARGCQESGSGGGHGSSTVGSQRSSVGGRCGSGTGDSRRGSTGASRASGTSDNHRSSTGDNCGSGAGDNQGSSNSDNRRDGTGDSRRNGTGDSSGSSTGDSCRSGTDVNTGNDSGDSRRSGTDDSHGRDIGDSCGSGTGGADEDIIQMSHKEKDCVKIDNEIKVRKIEDEMMCDVNDIHRQAQDTRNLNQELAKNNETQVSTDVESNAQPHSVEDEDMELSLTSHNGTDNLKSGAHDKNAQGGDLVYSQLNNHDSTDTAESHETLVKCHAEQNNTDVDGADFARPSEQAEQDQLSRRPALRNQTGNKSMHTRASRSASQSSILDSLRRMPSCDRSKEREGTAHDKQKGSRNGARCKNK